VPAEVCTRAEALPPSEALVPAGALAPALAAGGSCTVVSGSDRLECGKTEAQEGDTVAGGDASSLAFPYNLEFRTENFLVSEVEDRRGLPYDVVLCLKLTKWVQLHWGDAGLKVLFGKCFRMLRPGGVLVLEAQEWDSYKSSKHLTPEMRKMRSSLQMRPQDFTTYLVHSIGFAPPEAVGEVPPLKRRLLIFRRPAEIGASCSGGAGGVGGVSGGASISVNAAIVTTEVASTQVSSTLASTLEDEDTQPGLAAPATEPISSTSASGNAAMILGGGGHSDRAGEAPPPHQGAGSFRSSTDEGPDAKRQRTDSGEGVEGPGRPTSDGHDIC